MTEAGSRIAEWRRNPVLFVRDVFKAEPDLWQAEGLQLLGKPGRKRRRRAAEESAQADAGGHAPLETPGGLPAEREEA